MKEHYENSIHISTHPEVRLDEGRQGVQRLGQRPMPCNAPQKRWAWTHIVGNCGRYKSITCSNSVQTVWQYLIRPTFSKLLGCRPQVHTPWHAARPKRCQTCHGAKAALQQQRPRVLHVGINRADDQAPGSALRAPAVSWDTPRQPSKEIMVRPSLEASNSSLQWLMHKTYETGTW